LIRYLLFVAHHNKSELLVEGQPGELVLPFWYYSLDADSLVLVHIQIENMNFALGGHRREYGARVGSPFYIAHSGTQIKDEQRIGAHILPDLDPPVSSTGYKDVAIEAIEVNAIDGHVVGIVGHQVFGAKGSAALVDVAALGAHQKNLG